MKHIHLPWAFFVKSGTLRTSVYNVYGSQNEFVDSVTGVFILRMRSLGQNGPLRRDAVIAVARIELMYFCMQVLERDESSKHLERRLQQAEDCILSKEDEVNDLQAKVDDLGSELGAVKEQRNGLERELDTLQQTLRQAQTSLVDATQKHQQEVRL